ncbi:MAG: hypothetical protein WC577_00455 [Candidatus Paceibacterota bacterium]
MKSNLSGEVSPANCSSLKKIINELSFLFSKLLCKAFPENYFKFSK